MLEIRGLEAGYGLATVLRGVDLTVPAGRIVAVLGANGAGKTTLNMTISGLVRARAGSITFDGRRIDGLKPPAIAEAGLIHVPEGRKVFPNLTVRENLDLGAYRRARGNRARNMDRVFDTFPRLRERMRQRAGTLSGGEQQMLAIGRGMMAEPRLLILDEPSLGLSPLLMAEVLDRVRDIARAGTAVLLAEQNVHKALAVSNRAYVIRLGRLVRCAPAAELLRSDDLASAFLGG